MSNHIPPYGGNSGYQQEYSQPNQAMSGGQRSYPSQAGWDPNQNYAQGQPGGPKKGLSKTLIIVIVVVLLVAGGVGVYFFITYSQQNRAEQEVDMALESSFNTFDVLKEDAETMIGELEEDASSVTLLSNESALNSAIEDLQFLSKQHEEALKGMSAGPTDQTEDYQMEVGEKIARSQEYIDEMVKAYESMFCVNGYLLKFDELGVQSKEAADSFESLKDAEDKSDLTPVIQVVEQMVIPTEGYVSSMEEFKTCFADNGEVFNNSKALAEIEQNQQIYLEIQLGLQQMQEGLEEQSIDKIAAGQAQVAGAQEKFGTLVEAEDYYATFQNNISDIFQDYSNFAKDTSQELALRRDQLKS